ncbi:YdcF family protein [Brachybacterium kimchii]|uniref:YdcF family protein n=1 Tax=Brachybacterium kimchii TaxID=2942909 RepID=A0ABY4N133_9MICO|nr:YdcF family protein [Brachybacterium kimchii]UQN28262.1 YdcF family protein [Brachybacterium kimchii]
MTLVNDPPGSSEAIVVLGFKNPQPDANFINQIRVQVALRSIDPTAETRLIFSGGPTTATRSEARVMADYAVNKLGYQGAYLLEEESRSTWDNIANLLPMIEDVDRIKIASLPAHALKARVYVRRQRPDLASKLVKVADYKFGEWAALKPVLAAYSRRTLRAVREDLP